MSNPKEDERTPDNEKIIVEVVSGRAGPCLCFNDRRVAGPKPWGGGQVVYKFHVDQEEFRALSAQACNSHAALASTVDRLREALMLAEKADRIHSRCQECEDGAQAPEACENCFPSADDARVDRRNVLKSLGVLMRDVDKSKRCHCSQEDVHNYGPCDENCRSLADVSEWRAFHSLVQPNAWGVECGDDIIIPPSLSEDTAKFVVREYNSRAALNGVTQPAKPQRHGIYIASKTKHADRWRFLRDKVGEPIISTWIDEAGEGESADLNDLWRRCLSEAANCEVLILYRDPGDVLKGGWIELGAALANGVPVFAVGIEEYTVAKYRGIRHFPDMRAAIKEARVLLKSVHPSTEVEKISTDTEVRG